MDAIRTSIPAGLSAKTVPEWRLHERADATTELAISCRSALPDLPLAWRAGLHPVTPLHGVKPAAIYVIILYYHAASSGSTSAPNVSIKAVHVAGDLMDVNHIKPRFHVFSQPLDKAISSEPRRGALRQPRAQPWEIERPET
jgi:hypothetical protein